MPDKARGSATVAQIFGEITWLLSVSARHQDIALRDLNRFVMAPILLKQFHIFWDGGRPIGAAFWALLDDTNEARLLAALEQPGETARVEAEAWNSGERLWLIDIVAPFATSENRHAELIMADLVAGPLRGRQFKMIGLDGEQERPSIISFGAEVGDELVAYTKERLVLAGGYQ